MVVMYILTHSDIKGIMYFALRRFMYVLRIALTINCDYLPKQYKRVYFVIETDCVVCEVGTDILCIIYMYFS